jgi:hypothetical protein
MELYGTLHSSVAGYDTEHKLNVPRVMEHYGILHVSGLCKAKIKVICQELWKKLNV